MQHSFLELDWMFHCKENKKLKITEKYCQNLTLKRFQEENLLDQEPEIWYTFEPKHGTI